MSSLVVMRSRTRLEALLSIPDRDAVWWPQLMYVLMKRCHVDWCAASCERAEVPAEVEVPSVNVPNMDDIAKFHEKCGLSSRYRLRRSPSR